MIQPQLDSAYLGLTTRIQTLTKEEGEEPLSHEQKRQLQSDLNALLENHTSERTPEFNPGNHIEIIKYLRNQIEYKLSKLRKREKKRNKPKKIHKKNFHGINNEWEGVLFVLDKKENAIKHGKKAVLEGVYNHFEEIIAPLITPSVDTPLPESLPRSLYDPLAEIKETDWEHLMQVTTIEELERTISSLPKGKAPGPYGLTYEIYAQLFNSTNENSLTSLKALTELLNSCLSTSKFPKESSNGETILLPKDFVFKGDMKRTRPITLLDVYRKIIETLLNKRLNKILRDYHMLKGLNTVLKEEQELLKQSL
jgi:hypothetical protein